MKSKKAKSLLSFILSFAICTAVFSTVTAFTAINTDEKQTDDLPADKVVSFVPYHRLRCGIILKLTDCAVDFFIELNSDAGKCTVTCLPRASVRQSALPKEKGASPYEIARFFGLSAKRSIKASLMLVEEIIDAIGGITADLPCGLPSPANPTITLPREENLHFYGTSAAAMLKRAVRPTDKEQKFLCEIIALAVQKLLKSPTKELYLLIKNNSSTDLSYKDFFDSMPILPACAVDIECRPTNGVWIADEFYLY